MDLIYTEISTQRKAETIYGIIGFIKLVMF